MITGYYKMVGVSTSDEILLEKITPAEAEEMFKPEHRTYLGPVKTKTFAVPEPKQETWRDRPPLL